MCQHQKFLLSKHWEGPDFEFLWCQGRHQGSHDSLKVGMCDVPTWPEVQTHQENNIGQTKQGDSDVSPFLKKRGRHGLFFLHLALHDDSHTFSESQTGRLPAVATRTSAFMPSTPLARICWIQHHGPMSFIALGPIVFCSKGWTWPLLNFVDVTIGSAKIVGGGASPPP